MRPVRPPADDHPVALDDSLLACDAEIGEGAQVVIHAGAHIRQAALRVGLAYVLALVVGRIEAQDLVHIVGVPRGEHLIDHRNGLAHGLASPRKQKYGCLPDNRIVCLFAGQGPAQKLLSFCSGAGALDFPLPEDGGHARDAALEVAAVGAERQVQLLGGRSCVGAGRRYVCWSAR